MFEHFQLAPHDVDDDESGLTDGEIDAAIRSGDGVLGIVWYRGKTRTALASIPDISDFRLQGISGTFSFTNESADWISAWLERHWNADIPRRVVVEQKARDILRLFVPAGFGEDILKAKAADWHDTDQTKERTDQHVRVAVSKRWDVVLDALSDSRLRAYAMGPLV